MDEPEIGLIQRWWHWVSASPYHADYDLDLSVVFLRAMVGVLILGGMIFLIFLLIYWLLYHTVLTLIILASLFIILPIALSIGRQIVT